MYNLCIFYVSKNVLIYKSNCGYIYAVRPFYLYDDDFLAFAIYSISAILMSAETGMLPIFSAKFRA